MRYNAESNERKSRQSALTLAIALHLGLAALLYLSLDAHPKTEDDKSGVASSNTHVRVPSRPVNLP
ncbi:MAG: hypothetical protein KGS48_02555 [Bacteroidetes bacterium]|nr:hypothetical protein [Bacteroidota bacterium]